MPESPGKVYHALFLCTGNSARSLLAECALRRLGGERFRAYSAGSHPLPAPNPVTLAVLRELGHDTEGLRSKSWEEFAKPGAPELDFVFTVCDNARGEACPVFPGKPVTEHWGLADPAAFVGSEEEKREVFRRCYAEIERRVKHFIEHLED